MRFETKVPGLEAEYLPGCGSVILHRRGGRIDLSRKDLPEMARLLRRLQIQAEYSTTGETDADT